MCEQLARGGCLKAERLGVESATVESHVQCPYHYITRPLTSRQEIITTVTLNLKLALTITLTTTLLTLLNHSNYNCPGKEQKLICLWRISVL